MKKMKKTIAAVVFSAMLMLLTGLAAFASENTPWEGPDAWVGPGGYGEYTDKGVSAGTMFIMTIEPTPSPTPTAAPSKSGALPKTGDSGPEVETVLLAAAISGGGYLLCTVYDKRRED